MKLTFKTSHLSIVPFDPVEVPDFVVLTGVNGSGKSHLMAAISQRHVIVGGIPDPHIVLFNYEDFKLDNEGAFSSHELSAERESAWKLYEGSIKGPAAELRSQFGERYESLKLACQTENKNFWDLSDEIVGSYKRQVKTHFANQPFLRNNQQAQAIISLAKRLPYSIDQIRYDDFVLLYKPFALKHDFLPLQLGRVFWDYYVKYRANEVNEFQNAKHGKNLKVLSEEEFVAAHGKKPWDLINEILKRFDTLKYEVTSPEECDYFGSFELKLKHTENTNLEIEFSDLSSGERVLMALVASVYKSAADKHFPDLLLLDEVDASLHPSMMKNMLDVIERTFLDQGVKVMLVTHSPTTIALAPEESIFVMNRSGLNRIEKKPKAEALSILTQGFATIEQGLKLFDEVAKSQLTIITEGNNSRLIAKALELHRVSDVEVLTGAEEGSGKDQLKTLFRFFVKAEHKKKVIFVWDCDVATGLEAANNTYPFMLPQNQGNLIAKKGIENAFPVELFEGFTKTITPSIGVAKTEFDTNRKRDFELFILERSNENDFAHFASLIAEIQRISQL